jgi:hypothetical protein
MVCRVQGDLKLDSDLAKRKGLTEGGNQCAAYFCNGEFSFRQDTTLSATARELLAPWWRPAALASAPRPKALRNSMGIRPPVVE